MGISEKEGLIQVNPSTPQHKCWACSGLTLSDALTPLKGGAWRRRMGQSSEN
jgi:hypothetical protein